MLKISAIIATSIVAGVALFVSLKGWPGLIYSPAQITQPFAEYMAKRDPVLGWVKPVRDDLFPGEPCASVFGDSFTFSQEVSDAEAWPALLSGLLGCRVENYGVGGYGSDQAFLRFRQTPARGRVVMLNHLSENVLRNVNQFRNLIAPSHEWQLKPRFLPGGEFVPLPSSADALEHE